MKNILDQRQYLFVVILSLYTFFASDCQQRIHTIDFLESLGKNDPYYGTYYANCLQNANNKWSMWAHIGTYPKSINSLLNACLKLYKNYNLSHLAKVNKLENTIRIPKIIHQIWLGSEFPEKYKRWQEKWKQFDGWTYKLWTDKDVAGLKIRNQKAYNAAKNYGERADILRMEILYQFGGLYVDTDFECLNPQMFDILHANYDFYAGLHPLDANTFSLVNALIGVVPKHPMVKVYLDNIKYQSHITDIVIKSGPGFFTKCFMKAAEAGNYRNIVFPPSFFYPLGHKDVKRYGHLPEREVKKRIIKPESIAIHWWESSWEKEAAMVR